MTDNEPSSNQIFNKTVVINSTPSNVWDALTIPAMMKQWMTETDFDIITDWKVGSPIIMKGPWYKTGFENRGTVLQFEPERVLQYSHLSSLSRLPDVAENYSSVLFSLAPEGNRTTLTVSLTNFPTETIYTHLAFYWNVAIELLKKFVERDV